MIRISVITPLFDKEPYILETVASLQSQTVSDWEMLVVDNGSRDNGPLLAQSAATQDSRIRLLQSRKRGPGAARNCGLCHAEGEWILFLDADDVIEPDHLEKLLSAARANPSADIIAGGWKEFTDRHPTTFVLKSPAGRHPVTGVMDSAIAFCPWAIHAAIVRRRAFDEACYWPEELDNVLGEDVHFWFRVLLDHEVAYTESAGALYRVQTAGCRSRMDVIADWYRGIDQAIQANLASLSETGRVESPEQCESLMRSYSELYVEARRQQNAMVAQLALARANAWLQMCRNRNAPNLPWSIRARVLLGLRCYTRLQQLVKLVWRRNVNV